MRETAVWVGVMGKEYTYEVYSLAEDLPEEPGNYIFVRRNRHDGYRCTRDRRATCTPA